jgi:hypothetical protein
MIVVFTGLPGSGKSLKLAQTVVDILYRNKRYYEKTGKIRPVYLNLKMSKEIEIEFFDFIRYWTNLKDLVILRDVDIVIDEIATYFDAHNWATMSTEMKRFLQQHRKFGIDIYGTAQDFAQTDKSFRRLTSDLLYLTKLIGSGDISPTRPLPKFIWGVVLVKSLDPTKYDEQKSKFEGSGFPRFMFITRHATSIFDTRSEIKPSASLPLRHLVYECELPDCPHHKIVHA